MNATIIVTAGNLTSGPELPFTPSGKAVATVRVAVNHRVRLGEAWFDGEPAFYDITLWEGRRERGRVLPQGRPGPVRRPGDTEAWTDSDGAKRTKQVVTDAEIGASTRFSTVEVVRAKRETSGS
jgi:single-strand DNA-binding protein